MSLFWNRLPIACIPGWNNCEEAELEFVVTYDQANDRLVITANQCVFTNLDEINFQGSGGNGTIPSPSVQSCTVVWINNALVDLLAPTTITQLDFFDPGAVLIGTWTGSVDLTSLVITFAAGTYVDLNNDVSVPSLSAPQLCAAIGDGAVFASAMGIATTGDDSSIDGAIFTTFDDLTFEIDTGNGIVIEVIPGVWFIGSNALSGNTIKSFHLVDSGNAQLTDEFVLPSGPFPFINTAGGTCDETGVDIVFNPMDNGSASSFETGDTYFTVYGCAENGGTAFQASFYNPAGPGAGFNPVGPVITKWDTTGITITNVSSVIPENADIIVAGDNSTSGAFFFQDFL